MIAITTIKIRNQMEMHMGTTTIKTLIIMVEVVASILIFNLLLETAKAEALSLSFFIA